MLQIFLGESLVPLVDTLSTYYHEENKSMKFTKLSLWFSREKCLLHRIKHLIVILKRQRQYSKDQNFRKIKPQFLYFKQIITMY